MNTITVTAHGAPGSFVRRVQENPMLAVDLLNALVGIVDGLSNDDDEGLIEHAQQIIIARAAIAKAQS